MTASIRAGMMSTKLSRPIRRRTARVPRRRLGNRSQRLNASTIPTSCRPPPTCQGNGPARNCGSAIGSDEAAFDVVETSVVDESPLLAVVLNSSLAALAVLRSAPEANLYPEYPTPSDSTSTARIDAVLMPLL